MRNFPYGDRRTHTGIPVCERAGIAKKFAYGDPHTHNEIVRIWGLTYILYKVNYLVYSLTAMASHEKPLFYELFWCIITTKSLSFFSV